MNEKLNLLSKKVESINIENPIPVGQLYFPKWNRYEDAFRELFQREYYNNNGPLLNELENKLQEFLDVKHAICTSSATLGLMIAAQALELSGKVILPSHTFVASAQSLKWAGLKPIFCEVEKNSHHIDISELELLIDDDVSAIMAVNLWGGASDVLALEALAKKYNLKLYFDSAQAFGCKVGDKAIGNYGDLEVFSFHATKVLSAGEGGCICTNDDELAARLKAIRPSYNSSSTTSIVKVANARMSEAQAAIALMSLDEFENNVNNNKRIFNLYQHRLSNIAGINLKPPVGVTQSNYQSVVCHVNEKEFGTSRDKLLDILKSKNILSRRYFYPGTHKTVGFNKENVDLPITDELSKVSLQLPIGAFVDASVVDAICDIIELTQTMPQHFNSVLMANEQ